MLLGSTCSRILKMPYMRKEVHDGSIIEVVVHSLAYPGQGLGVLDVLPEQ